LFRTINKTSHLQKAKKYCFFWPFLSPLLNQGHRHKIKLTAAKRAAPNSPQGQQKPKDLLLTVHLNKELTTTKTERGLPLMIKNGRAPQRNYQRKAPPMVQNGAKWCKI